MLVLILGSSSSDDVRGPSDVIKGSGVKTIAVGTDSSVPVNQLNIIATGGDTVITTTTIIKINTILQPVIDKINDGKYHDRHNAISCYVSEVKWKYFNETTD